MTNSSVGFPQFYQIQQILDRFLGLRSLRAGFWTGEHVLAKSCEQAICKRQSLMAEKTLAITSKA